MSADRLFEDYNVKLDYVRAQYDRLWQRFNYFLSVELGLFGFLGYLTFDRQVREATSLAAWMGIAVSLLWYVVGAEDRRLVEVYRQRADDAAVRFGAAEGGLKGFEQDHAAAEIPSHRHPFDFRSWYWPRLSMTKMPATFGLVLIVIWSGVLLFWNTSVFDRLVPLIPK